MRLDIEQVKRLGFDAWADNVVVNIMEDMKDKSFDRMTIEGLDYEVFISNVGKEMQYVVKAYLPGEGWKWSERTIKKGGQS
jgi:hypothetical protein